LTVFKAFPAWAGAEERINDSFTLHKGESGFLRAARARRKLVARGLNAVKKNKKIKGYERARE